MRAALRFVAVLFDVDILHARPKKMIVISFRCFVREFMDLLVGQSGASHVTPHFAENRKGVAVVSEKLDGDLRIFDRMSVDHFLRDVF